MAARDERILEELASGDIAGLDVVYLKIGREIDLGGVEQRDIAVSCDPDLKRGCVVDGKFVSGKRCGHAELAHSAAEGGRRTVGKPVHMHRDRIRGQTLAYTLIVVLEKFVKNRPGGRSVHPDIDHADHLRRVDDDVARLLRNESPASYQRNIVYFPVNAFSMEFQICRSLGLLTPEAVESRELDILETYEIHPLVKFERRRDGLPDHHIGLAEVK